MCEIKNSFAFLTKHVPDKGLDKLTHLELDQIRKAMKEYAEQFIDLASEEAQITDGETSSDIMGDSTEYGESSYFIDKESILKVKQLIR